MTLRMTCITIGIAFFALAGGCGSSSNGSGVGRSSVKIVVNDETGKPLPGFTVSVSTLSTTALTDSVGMALLENVPSGLADISVVKSGYPQFSQEATIIADMPLEKIFTYINSVPVTVTDEKGRPVAGANIFTKPPTQTLTTDSSGRATFTHMPKTTTTFTVRRSNLKDVNYIAEPAGTVAIHVQSGSPAMNIVTPGMDDIISVPTNVTLKGTGVDFEDGALPDSSFAWYSSIDGFLGKGSTFVVPALSSGYHKLTLKGTDSDNNISETMISFTVFDYQLDSYFPIPAGEIWTHRYLVSEFYLTNSENVNEYWVLKGITTKITNDHNRVVDIYWDTTIQSQTTHFRLTLSDSLIRENNSLYISQTVERSYEWTGTTEKPYFIVSIGTEYQPRFLFLKNVTNPAAEPSYQTSVRAETAFSYTYYSTKSQVFHDSKTITSAVTVGSEEYVQTDRGIYKGIIVTFKQDNAEKKMYLAKGIGPIRLEDMALNINTVSVLSSATLLRFHTPTTKAVSGIQGAVPAAPPVYDLRIDRKNPGDMLRLHRFLSGLVPRCGAL